MRTLAFVFALLFARTVWAGCEKDTDCKGSRVCENGVCVGAGPEAPPPPAVRATRERPPPTPQDVGKARRRAIASLVLSPFGVIGAAAGAPFAPLIDEDDDLWPGLAVTELVTLGLVASGYGLGLHGSLIARRAMKGERGTGLLIAGIVVGGIGMLGIVVNTILTFAFNEDDDAVVGNTVGFSTSAVIGAAGGIILGVDALLSAKQLEAEEEVVDTEETTMWIGPMILREGAGAQFVALF